MQPLILWLVVIRMQLQPDVRLCLARSLQDFSHETMRDSSLARSLVSQGWSRKKSRSRKNPIETLRDPTLVFAGLFCDHTLTDRTLFWMASVRCDFQHQSVRSVKTTPTERKNQFFCAVCVEYILRWNSTLKPCRQNRSTMTRVCLSNNISTTWQS